MGDDGVTADTVDFHSSLMAHYLLPTSVPFLVCGRPWRPLALVDAGWPSCQLAAQCHVWAGSGWGPVCLLLLCGGALRAQGSGPGKVEGGKGVDVDRSTLPFLRNAAEGKSCAFEVGTLEGLFTQRGERARFTRMPVS